MNLIQINDQIVEEIINLYVEHGSAEYIGEPISQLEHMCQCAELAEQNGADEATILAAFLHDIGHLYEFASADVGISHMDEYGLVDHEQLGARYLRHRGFSEDIAKMVESHVKAKRYLTAKFPAYYEELSEASKATLLHQGGPMAADEAEAFEQDRLFDNYIALRRWDEQAKIANKPLVDLEHYKTMMLDHLSTQQDF
jgi:phosphonate degradation associated HDIG domain protein